MKILTYPLGELQANCYFLVQDKDCLIIDAGDSADFILEEISRNNLTVTAILATHGHFDHVMAVGELQASLNVPLYISEMDRFLLDRVEQTAKHFLSHIPEMLPITNTTDLVAGTLRIPDFAKATTGGKNFELRTIQAPGHTPGSVCFYIPEENALFTGDALFKDGIGRYDFSYSNKKELFASIKHIMKTLPGVTVIYPGHGESSMLEEEGKNLTQFF